MDEPNNKQQPKRNWFSFSLRTLMLVTLMSGVGFGWLGMKWRAKQQERKWIEQVHNFDFVVRYDYQTKFDGPWDEATPPGPYWIRSVLGDDWFATPAYIHESLSRRRGRVQSIDNLRVLAQFSKYDGLTVGHCHCDDSVTLSALMDLQHLPVTHLSLQSYDVTSPPLRPLHGIKELRCLYIFSTATDEALSEIAGISQLESLSIWESPITDAGLIPLKKLTQLESLQLRRNFIPGQGQMQITDAGLLHIKEMKNLQTLDLWFCLVTDAGLIHVQELKNLKRLELYGTKITDDGLEHLKAMKHLVFLDLSHTKVTEEGVKNLQIYLPNTETNLFTKYGDSYWE